MVVRARVAKHFKRFTGNDKDNSCGIFLGGVKTKSLYQEATIHTGVKQCWSRPVTKILTQAAKDVPRYCGAVIFCSHEEENEIQESFSNFVANQTKPESFFLSNKIKITEDINIQTTENQEQMNDNQRVNYKLKTLLLIMSYFYELEHENSNIFKKISTQINLQETDKLQQHNVFNLFKDCFIPENSDLQSLKFPVPSITFNIMRALTQGHISHPCNEFQTRLGLKIVTTCIEHLIYIVLPDTSLPESEQVTKVYHYRAEKGVSGWGNIKWFLRVDIDSKGNKLRLVHFRIYDVKFAVSTKV